MKYFSIKHPAFFGFIIFTLYVPALWGFSIPLTGDQKVYLSIALEMFQKQSWIIPTLFDEPNFLKPPFQYWMTILGWKAFGLSLWGALIPSVLALIASAILIFKMGKEIGLLRPWIAALLFAGCLGTMTYGSTAQMEIWIVCLYLAAWFARLKSKNGIAFVLVGIMAWVKGPLYPVLWTLSVVLFNKYELKRSRFWWAMFVGILIGLIWYGLAALTHREEMMRQFFFQENLSKISTTQGSAFGLWFEFLFSLFPWIFILCFGFLQKSTRKEWLSKSHFYFSFAAIPALFFTFFPYRVNTYLYLLTPIAAMMASEVELMHFKIKNAMVLIYSLVWIGLTFITFRLVSGGWIGSEIVFSLSLASLVFLVGLYKGTLREVSIASLIIVNLVRISAVQIGEKDIAGLRQYSQNSSSNLMYYMEGRDIWHESGLVSAALGYTVLHTFNKNEAEQQLASGGSLILSDENKETFSQPIQCSTWPRIKKRMKFPIKKLLFENLTWNDPEMTRLFYICSTKR